MKIFEVIPGLYRGERPMSIPELSDFVRIRGIRTIISLETGLGAFWDKIMRRSFREEALWREFFSGTMIRVPLSSFTPPNKNEVEHVLEAIEQHLSAEHAVFVHCYAGVDRTGFVIACHRAIKQGVHPEIAWRECIAMGMHARYWWWKEEFLEIVKGLLK